MEEALEYKEFRAAEAYAHELYDRGEIGAFALHIYFLLTGKYHRPGSQFTQVGLAELAGDRNTEGAVIKALRELEAAGLIEKEKQWIVQNGRYRQLPNRYHLHTVEQAKLLTCPLEEAEAEADYLIATSEAPSITVSQGGGLTMNLAAKAEILDISLPPCDSETKSVSGIDSKESKQVRANTVPCPVDNARIWPFGSARMPESVRVRRTLGIRDGFAGWEARQQAWRPGMTDQPMLIERPSHVVTEAKTVLATRCATIEARMAAARHARHA
jgi:hypothetical protein